MNASGSVISWLVLAAIMPLAASASSRELLIINGKVWTGEPGRQEVQTILIRGAHIAEVGGEALAGKHRHADHVQVIDARGRRVIPGLIDCHTHVLSGGLNLTKLQLREARDRQDFIRRVTEYAAQHEKDAWILGRGWTTESWSDPQQPTTAWLDPVTTGRLAFLTRMDGHQAVVNSRALKMAGITRATPDPQGGRIGRHPASGEPNGILKDAAMDLVSSLIPPPTMQQQMQALERAKRLFNQHGVTMVHDMSNPQDGRLFAAALTAQAANPALPRLRLVSYCQTENWSATPCFEGPLDPAQDWLRAAGFKGYMDGSLGSRTAYLAAPYNDNPALQKSNRGLLIGFATRPAPQDMLTMMRTAARARLQPAVHAIGDQANHLVLDAYQRLAKDFDNLRPRIEHAQHLLPEDIPRFSQLGVIASMQPLHKADDGRYAERRLGARRCQSSYAFKSLLANNTVVCFGSDWPVVSNNPFLGMDAAVSGRTLEGEVFVPEQNITVAQALQCYTRNAAQACFSEDRLGAIKPGYLADIVILDQDILSIPAERIAQTQVDLTIVGGHIVWQRDTTPSTAAPN